MSYDVTRNILYVARTRASDNGAILAFNNAGTANDDIAPTRTIRTFTIGSNHFSLNSPSDVFIDSGNDRIYIADVDVGAASGTIVILDNAGTTPTFRKIFGFTIGAPAAISLDAAHDRLYVSSRDGAGYLVGVVERLSTFDGAVSFSRQLTGFGVAAGMTGF